MSYPFQQVISKLSGDLNQLAAYTRKRDERIEDIGRQVKALQALLPSLKVSGGTSLNGDAGGPSGGVRCPWSGQIKRIEEIPGARIPYTLLAEIPIAADSLSTRLVQSVPISQEGPFIAVRRVATFVSNFAFQVTDPQTQVVARFSGRSNGRYRPVSSAWDLFDAMQSHSDGGAFYLRRLIDSGFAAGILLPSAALALPTNASSFRTMMPDFTVRVTVESAQMARQNMEVPSSIWASGINDPTTLGALDFFSRNESITFEVQQNHGNNPSYGNVDGLTIFPNAAATGWPFIAGQFDAHEGIATPRCSDVSDGDQEIPDLLATDAIERAAEGILYVGYEGYKIVQPYGAS